MAVSLWFVGGVDGGWPNLRLGSVMKQAETHSGRKREDSIFKYTRRRSTYQP